MKPLALFLFIAIVLVGVVKSSAQAIPEVDFCALFDSYDKYAGKTISTAALMTYSTVTRVDGDGMVLYSLKCNDSDHFALPYFNTEQSSKFLEGIEQRKPESNFIFAIKFVGRITIEEVPAFGHLAWSRAEIKIRSTKSPEILDPEPNWPNGNAPAPLTERAKRLQGNAHSFLKSVVITPKKMEIDIPSLLADDFIFISKGVVLNKNQYLILNTPLVANSGEFSYGYVTVKRDKESVTVNGVIEADRRTKDAKTFNCTMKYVLKDGWWLLKSARMK